MNYYCPMKTRSSLTVLKMRPRQGEALYATPPEQMIEGRCRSIFGVDNLSLLGGSRCLNWFKRHRAVPTQIFWPWWI